MGWWKERNGNDMALQSDNGGAGNHTMLKAKQVHETRKNRHHQIVWAERDLKDPPVPTPCPG